jgi:hypothetical protein
MLSRKHDAKIAEEFLVRLPSMPIRVVLPEEEDIIAAAKLKSARKISYALSLLSLRRKVLHSLRVTRSCAKWPM